jgi:hypothetical protein
MSFIRRRKFGYGNGRMPCENGRRGWSDVALSQGMSGVARCEEARRVLLWRY